jgi:hypothetical protein
MALTSVARFVADCFDCSRECVPLVTRWAAGTGVYLLYQQVGGWYRCVTFCKRLHSHEHTGRAEGTQFAVLQAAQHSSVYISAGEPSCSFPFYNDCFQVRTQILRPGAGASHHQHHLA